MIELPADTKLIDGSTIALAPEGLLQIHLNPPAFFDLMELGFQLLHILGRHHNTDIFSHSHRTAWKSIRKHDEVSRNPHTGMHNEFFLFFTQGIVTAWVISKGHDFI